MALPEGLSMFVREAARWSGLAVMAVGDAGKGG
jgi:hypothetical protein